MDLCHVQMWNFGFKCTDVIFMCFETINFQCSYSNEQKQNEQYAFWFVTTFIMYFIWALKVVYLKSSHFQEIPRDLYG